MVQEFFQKGDKVEVRLEDPGLEGSWHPAKICGVKPGLRQVQFYKIDNEYGRKFKEWVQFGTNAHSGQLPQGTRLITDGRPLLRPGGFGMPPKEPSFMKTGGWPKDLWVEAHERDAWWEGVLYEDLLPGHFDDLNSTVDVLFPMLGPIVEEVRLKNLRVCKEWSPDTGKWAVRGPYLSRLSLWEKARASATSFTNGF